MLPPETRPLLGGAAGEGPGAAGRGGRDAVPGKRCRVPVRKANNELPSRVPRFPPMYASQGSGPEAALPASGPRSTLGFRGSGGGQGCVPQERKRPGGVHAPGRGANVGQVSEAAGAGVSLPGSPSLCPAAARTPAVELGPTLRLRGLRDPPPSRPAPLSGCQLAPGWAAPPFPPRGRGSCCPTPSAPRRAPGEPSPRRAVSSALGGWVVRPS